MNRYVFQSTIKKIEEKLKHAEGNEYQGLVSIALYLTHHYFNTYYKMRTSEYIYLKTQTVVYFILLDWLSRNYQQCKERLGFSFDKAIKQAHHGLYPLKKKLMFMWINGKFAPEYKIEVNKRYGWLGCNPGKEYSLEKTLYINLLRDFQKFDVSRLKDFKQELGL